MPRLRPGLGSGVRIAVVCSLAALLLSGPTRSLQADQPLKTTQARPTPTDVDRLVREMSRYLTSLKHFKVHTRQRTEVVLTNGQKLQFSADSNLLVERPNRIRSDRVGDRSRFSFYYDGKQMTLYDPGRKTYAVMPAPPTIDGAIQEAERSMDRVTPGTIDSVRQQLDHLPPVVDLIGSDPYAAITDDIIDGIYVGPAVVNGVTCHHVALRGREVDVQLWIAQGARPLPLRYVITTKKTTGQPEYSVELSNWDTSARPSAGQFTFSPPRGVSKIDFGSFLGSQGK